MINVRSLLQTESSLNFIIFADDPINNIIYVQDQDIKIIHYLLPQWVRLVNIQNKEKHSYYSVTKSQALRLIDELEKHKINYKICNTGHNNVNVTYTKDFYDKNNYDRFKNKAHNKDKSMDDKTQTNKNYHKKSASSSTVKSKKFSNKSSKISLSKKSEKKHQRKLYNNSSKDRSLPLTHGIQHKQLLPPGHGQNTGEKREITSNTFYKEPAKALRINSNKDLSHLDELADEQKAIQRTHRKHLPDPEKPTQGDMDAKRFGEFYKLD